MLLEKPVVFIKRNKQINKKIKFYISNKIYV